MATDVGALQIKIYAGIAQLQNDMDKANKVVSGFATRTEATLGRVKTAFGAIGAGAAITVVKRMADEYAKFDTQLKLATTSTESYKRAYQDVVNISKASQNDIGATGVLYARLARNLRSSGTAQSEIAKITETVSLALRVNNASAQEASSTMLQLSQAFGAGALQGQEFMAVAESSPMLLEQLAKSMNVPYEALRKLREEGKLTRDQMLKAWTDPAFLASLREQAKEIRTIGAAQTYFINQLKLFIGETDKAISASRGFAFLIKLMADGIEYFATIAIVLAIKKLKELASARILMMQQERLASQQMIANTQAQAAIEQQRHLAEVNNLDKELGIRKLKLLASRDILTSKVKEAEWAVIEASNTKKQTVATEILTNAKAKLLVVERQLANLQNVSVLSFNNNRDAVNKMSASLATVPPRLTMIQQAGVMATGAMKGLGVAINAMGGWIGLAIGAVILFGDKLYGLYKQTIGLTPAIEAMNERIAENNRLRGLGVDPTDKNAKEKSAVAELNNEIAKQVELRTKLLRLAKGEKVDLPFSEKSGIGSFGVGGLGGFEVNQTLLQKRIGDINRDIIMQKEKLKDLGTTTAQVTKISEEGWNAATQSIKTTTSVLAEYKAKIDAVRAEGAKLGKSQSIIDENVKALEREREKDLKSLKDKVVVNKELSQQAQSRIDAEKEIADMQSVTLLVTKQGLDIEEAKFRVEQARAGLTEPLINSLLKEKAIQDEILEKLQEKQEYVKRYIEMNIEAEKDRLKGIEENAKAWREWDDESVKRTQDAEEEKRKQYEKSAETLQSSITDALLRGFEKGKSIADNFKSTLRNMFKTLVLTPAINFLTSPISKALAGISGGLLGGDALAAQQGAGGSTFDLFEAGKGIWDSIKGGTDAIQRGVESVGSWLSEGSGWMKDLGGQIGTYSAEISAALPYAGSVLSLLKGDFKGAAIQGAATAIGSAFGAPVLGAIAGKLISGLFGGKDYDRYGSFVSGSSANGSFNETSRGKVFDKDIGAGGQLADVSKSFTSTLNSLVIGMGGTLTDLTTYADVYQRGKSKVAGSRFNIGLNGQQIKIDASNKNLDVKKAFEDMVAKLFSEGLVKAIKASNIQDSFKSLFDTVTGQEGVTRMVTAISQLTSASSQLADRFGITTAQASNVANSTGLAGDALADFVSKLALSAGAFKTPSQQIIEVRDALTSSLGGILPDTLDLFDARLKSIDKTTSSGIAEFNKLFGLRDTFAAYTGQKDNTKTGVEGAIYNLMNAGGQNAVNRTKLAESFAQFGLAVPSSTQGLIDMGKSIDYSTEKGLDLALAFPTLVDQFKAVTDAVSATADAFNELNENQFSNVIDFKRAQAYKAQGLGFQQLITNVPSYDVGTPYVPNDGLAMIHKGERVVTAQENQSISATNAELLAEIRMLRQEVTALKSATSATAQNTRNTETILRRVTNDGNSLYTTAA